MRPVRDILLCVPQTAGDVLICTGILPGLRKKWPDADIWFATEKRYFNILEGNPFIKKVTEYHKTMLNYRNYETWGPQLNTFDIVYHPTIVTQHIPMWIHGGHGDYIGHVYAHLCDLDRSEYGPQFLRIDEDPELNLPPAGSYVTVHSRTNQDPKNYDYLQEVVSRVKGYQIVQVGGDEDFPLQGVSVDLRGRTTPQTLAWALQGARLHIGLDSFPMHVATLVGTPSVVLFGGTYAKQGVWPEKAQLISALEPDDRFMCPTSCHLIDCEMKKRGLDKCINNLTVRETLDAVADRLGEDCVDFQDPVKISAYLIIRDGIKYQFPFRESITAAAKVADEVVVVDGGSTDGTVEALHELKENLKNLRIYSTEWDVENNPTLFGDEKTRARMFCQGTHLLQLDADEIIHEPRPGALRELVEKHRDVDVIDIPVINFYGDDSMIRVEPTSWKWRVSRSGRNIVHGVHAQARQQDEQGRVVMDKRISDACEYIYAENAMIARHKPVFDLSYELVHQETLREPTEKKKAEYADRLKKLVDEECLVFHYSWRDLDRKRTNGEFWDKTWHGQREATHNTTENIADRVDASDDILVRVDFDHPLRENR